MGCSSPPPSPRWAAWFCSRSWKKPYYRRERVTTFPPTDTPGVVHPQGYVYLKQFRLDPFPVFVYRDRWRPTCKIAVFMVDGQDTTVIQYELHGQAENCTLELRPLIAFRDYHCTTHENGCAQSGIGDRSRQRPDHSVSRRAVALSGARGRGSAASRRVVSATLNMTGSASAAWIIRKTSIQSIHAGAGFERAIRGRP